MNRTQLPGFNSTYAPTPMYTKRAFFQHIIVSVGLEVGLRQIGTLALLTQKDCTRRRTSIFFLSSIARKRIVTKVPTEF